MYQVTVAAFNGPLDLLLQLITSKNLEITQISLAQITSDYTNYVANNTTHFSPTELADFLVILATLLLIKSKALLPNLELTSDEESEVLNLEERLTLYKFFREQGQYLNEQIQKKKFLYARPLNNEDVAIFLPPPNLTALDLYQSFQRLTSILEPEEELEEHKINKRISLEERIKSLLSRLAHNQTYTLEDLVADPLRKTDLILTFLAILQLSKDGFVTIDQKNNFEAIWITSL